MASKRPIETDARGIPLTDDTYPESPPVPILYGTANLVLITIGYCIARFACYRGGSRESADTKMALLASFDLGWLYAGIFILRVAQVPLLILLGIARKESKIGLPDQHVYKVRGAEGSKLGYVFMETEDELLGKFNRSQRALQNYYEQFPMVALQYVAASFVFPFPSFVCIVIWAISCYLGNQSMRTGCQLFQKC